MSTNALAKHYARLTPAERLSLILAASARGDHQERNRLLTSAPCVSYRTSDHFALAMALSELCALYRMKMLELAALYLYGSSTAAATGGKQGRRLGAVARWFGYQLQVSRAGWQQFCQEQNLNPDPLMAWMPGAEVVGLAATQAEQAAVTAEEARACQHREGLGEAAVPTAADVAAELKEALKVLVDWWG